MAGRLPRGLQGHWLFPQMKESRGHAALLFLIRFPLFHAFREGFAATNTSSILQPSETVWSIS